MSPELVNLFATTTEPNELEASFSTEIWSLETVCLELCGLNIKIQTNQDDPKEELCFESVDMKITLNFFPKCQSTKSQAEFEFEQFYRQVFPTQTRFSRFGTLSC